ncbi:protein of unknown function - conserved [Leishmania donovani]|uniref:Uncharacterized protein n=3 Tax=Leishmania donovani species complex TaxID=38574 RepID=A4I5B2_LEIIN|nr:conserved hypothetical protein [Leishmania infantum JPCM5]XP_003862799.1 hypothetical protein, conserved [Leishmania donovani]CAC9512510.1 hypothetical_protein_-_conserved [Leishmania infantum]TPP43427.1 hypothetical protein CGC20_7305 [Leishmania donovani]TPP45651.1 hypothetical protein CGC21_35210 [Leishmania donovani]CAJ1990868.1 protein of unknown function - conserved [Leishmania donovani]CAM69980.1 conserved hypothetical protein [Leishmania infantum JPCM5]|eukprot:XP_001466931.1 conserved hypothetical protein [Leishmania infantum JPCM5]
MKLFSYQSSVCGTLVLALCLLYCVLAASSTPAPTDLITVAGRVHVRNEVVQYVVVRVVDDKTGVVVRSAPLDATRSVSFANIASSAVSLEATVELPDHLFELDASSSVLKSAISTSSSTTPVQLTISTISKAEGAARKAPTPTAGSSGASAVLALMALVAGWYSRHKIVSVLDMPSLRMPKPRKVMGSFASSKRASMR